MLHIFIMRHYTVGYDALTHSENALMVTTRMRNQRIQVVGH